MKVFAVDIGNTTIVAGILENGKCLCRSQISSRGNPGAAGSAFGETLDELTRAHGELEASIISSVVPDLLPDISARIAARLGSPAHVLSHDTPLPIRNGYFRPREVGLDRLANAAGAVSIAGAPVVVVDAGTAVTLEIVNKEQVFVGGAIIPGAELWASALAAHTAALPRVELVQLHRVVGTTTIENIQSGIVHGLAGAVDRLVQSSMRELGITAPVLLTGGGALFLEPLLTCSPRPVPDLTLLGLAWIREQVRQA